MEINKVIQCDLECYTEEGDEWVTRRMVTWLDANKGIRVGSMVKLKDFKPEISWRVMWMSQPHARSDIKRGWGMTDFIGTVPHASNS
jgi:hypothetical protein